MEFKDKIIEQYGLLKTDFIENPLFSEILDEIELELFSKFKDAETQPELVSIHNELKALKTIKGKINSIATHYNNYTK